MGKAPIQLARMSMGLSALKQHRHIYHYLPQHAYVNCGIRHEDCKHFFLQCPTYQPARDTLFAVVAPILSNLYPNMNNLSNREKDSITNLFLQGDDRLTLETNKHIFNQIFIYISSAQRMK